MIQMQIAVIKKAVKDLDAEKKDDKSSAIVYLFGENFVNDCKTFAIDYEFIREKCSEICAQEGVRRKHLIRKLLDKLIAYT